MARRKSKKKPYAFQSQYQIAYLDLLKRDGRTRTASVRSEAASRCVQALDSNRWIVKGGYCDHTVLMQDGQAFCVDHEPAHKRNEGQACCHEIAVYKVLAWNHIPTLFTPEGLRRNGKEAE